MKNTAGKLVNMHPDKVIEDFDNNKKALDDLVFIPSKKLRNTIASYITHQINITQLKKPEKEDRSA
jgi:ribosomal protein S17E